MNRQLKFAAMIRSINDRFSDSELLWVNVMDKGEYLVVQYELGVVDDFIVIVNFFDEEHLFNQIRNELANRLMP